MPDGSDIPPSDASRPRPSLQVVEYRRPGAASPLNGPSRDLDELVRDEPSGLTRLLRMLVAVILIISLALVLWLAFIGMSPR